MVTGSVAEEEAVPKAVVKALVMLAMNLKKKKTFFEWELISMMKYSS
jgi:hypothetical protein